MLDLTILPVGQAYTDVLRRLSRQWAGRAVTKAEVLRVATQYGRVGMVAISGGNRDNVAGFLLGTAEGDDRLEISWLVAHPAHRQQVIRFLLDAADREFPGFDFVVRVPNVEDMKYEYLADLRDAAWADVTPDSSRSIKVTDEYASYVYVRLGGRQALDRSGGHDGPAPVGKRPRQAT